jgi:hypothetical protein
MKHQAETLAGARPAELPRLNGSPRAPSSPAAREKTSDAMIAAVGIVLGVTCALFPWYIFLNPDQFGIRAMTFQGNRDNALATSTSYQPSLVGQPMTAADIPQLNLDFLPTGSLPTGTGTVAPPADQPFPADLVTYRLVHVANGRAMIEDVDGLWVVQPGARLPDASFVKALERRDGRWVIVTSTDRVVVMSE